MKNNYNFNDSNWVNEALVLAKLMSVAKAANGGVEVPKKAVSESLADIKEILKASAKAIPVKAKPAATATTQTPSPEAIAAAQQVMAQAAAEEETIGDVNAEVLEQAAAGDEIKTDEQAAA